MKNLTKNLENLISILITLIFFTYIFLFFFFFFRGGYLDPMLPLEAREYASTSSILAFANNQNPFSFEEFPINVNAYSALWPFLLGNICKLFQIHNAHQIIIFSRVVSLIFFFLGIYFFYLYYRKKIPLNLLIFLLIFFIISTTLKISLGTWSTGAGLVLYFIGILISFEAQSRKNYLVSAFLFLIAAHLKIYFILGFLILTFNYINFFFRKKYLLCNALIALFLIIMISVHYYYFPTYYFISILNQINITNFSNFNTFNFILSKKLYSELFFLIKNYFYLLLIFFYFLFLYLKTVKLLNFLFVIKLSFIVFFIYLVIFKLWPNFGNFGTYSNNLIIPVLIAFVIKLYSFIKNKKTIKKNLNFFFIIVIIFPISTNIFNWNYPGVLKSIDIESNHKNFNIIKKILNNNENVYFDHYLGSFNNHKIGKILYFNGNADHIFTSSINNFTNYLIINFFQTDRIYYNYKKNYQVGIKEINHKYNFLICSFVCFNLSDSNNNSDFFGIYSKYSYKEINSLKIINLFGQEYFVKIIKLN